MVPGADFGDDELLRLAGTMEAHPDNIAAALLGSFTIAWVEEQGARAVRLSLHPSVHAVVAVPSGSVPTAKARAALEERVPMGDASFNAGRAALLVHALANPEPDLLLAATADRLHQEARRAVYPESLALVERLRAQGLAAVISGAGPSVLVLQSGADETSAVAQSAGHAWTVRRLDVSVRGVVQLP
jgi:homoserine kinase